MKITTARQKAITHATRAVENMERSIKAGEVSENPEMEAARAQQEITLALWKEIHHALLTAPLREEAGL